MIEGMAHAGRVFGRRDWMASARRARDFIANTMWRSRRLLATHKDGKTRLNAYLDDYAFLLKALIELAQADFQAEDLAFACELADVLLEQFEDTARGGFFFTSHDHESLIQRPKPALDHATPSGNGVAAFTLQRLAHLVGDMRYERDTERTLSCFYAAIADHPSGHGSLLMALEKMLRPPRMLILTGPQVALSAWQQIGCETYQPDLMTLTIANDTPDLPTALQRPEHAFVNAWLCQGVSCLTPVTEMSQLRAALKTSIVPPALIEH